MPVCNQGVHDPKRGPGKDVGAVVLEVAYSSRTDKACDGHWSKRNKKEEGMCASTSHGDVEFESRGQE